MHYALFMHYAQFCTHALGFPCQPEMAFFSFFFRVRIPIRIWMEKEHHDSVQMEQEMEKAKSTL